MRKAFIVISFTVLSVTAMLIFVNWKFSLLLLIFIPLVLDGIIRYVPIQADHQT